MLERLKAWHGKPAGPALYATAELVLAYLFASLSIDRGNLWYYLLTLIFLIGALKNLIVLIVRKSYARSN